MNNSSIPGGPDVENKMTREEEEERLHFQKVTNAFRSYKKHSIASVHRREEYLNRLPKEHQRLLRKHGYQDSLDDMKEAIEQNNIIITSIMNDVEGIFENVTHNIKNETDSRIRPTNVDMDKVQSTLKQIVRDWSSVGSAERSACYGPIISALKSLYPDPGERDKVKVLVPGAGLGRLAFDIATEGFECQANEFSLYMLFASNFILNKSQSINCYKIHPYVHNMSNNMTSSDQMKSVQFPDVDTKLLPDEAKFSMAAGDFLEVYSEPEYFGSQDCVITCFFMDCAHNILQFVQVIQRVLKQGGVWIHLGPLLYHFSDIKGEDSIEPSYSCLKEIIRDMGFTFLSEETNLSCTYDQNPSSMLQYQYNCVFFTARKS